MSTPRALKALERAWKRVAFRALGALLPTPRSQPAPRWDRRPHRVLYLRYDRIGDMIMATPSQPVIDALTAVLARVAGGSGSTTESG